MRYAILLYMKIFIDRFRRRQVDITLKYRIIGQMERCVEVDKDHADYGLITFNEFKYSDFRRYSLQGMSKKRARNTGSILLFFRLVLFLA